MFFKRFLSLFLLLILPTLAMQRMHDPLEQVLPMLQRSLPKPQQQRSQHTLLRSTSTPWNSKAFKYDDILTFLNDLESGELEKRCSDGDLEQINQFVADLAREGHIPGLAGDAQELEQDIEELLGISDPYAFRYAPAERSSCELTPALYYGDHEVLHCGWFKKAWKKSKKFCKKHKKAIIIGAVVVVAVTTVVVVAVAASSSAAAGGAVAAAGGSEGSGVAGGLAAAGGAAAGASSSKKSDDQPSTTPGINDAIASRPDPTPLAPPQAPKSKSPPQVEQIVEKHIQNFRETIAEERPAIDLAKPNEPLPFEEAARVHGAYAAREAVTEIVGSGPDATTTAQPLAEVDNAFGVCSANIAPVGTALAAGRLASRVPGGPTVKAAAATGAAAYALYNPEGVQSAFDVAHDGASYVADKALEGVTYVKDRVIEAVDSVASWASGSQPITNLESRSGEGVADDRVIKDDGRIVDQNFKDEALGKCQEIKKGDRTRAGQPLDKHGNRPITDYPKPKGNAKEVNDLGLEVVEDILNDPDARIYERERGGREVRLPNGKGVRFNENNQQTGLLEPDWVMEQIDGK